MPIASRVLKYRAVGSSHDLLLPITFEAPEQNSENVWRCSYEIGWPDGLEVQEAYGVDSVQALYLAMQIVGAEIYTSDYHKNGTLRFETSGGGYGFPVVGTLRDLLEGDDRTGEYKARRF